MNLVPVDSPRLLGAFIRLPWGLYAGDPNWVPPLVASEKKMLDPRRNPFYRRAEAAHFLAERDGRFTGRISAILNRAHNEFHSEKTGFWGWFECEDDPATAAALFDRAAAWLRERGMERMLGPANPSLNDPCGMLVDGFQAPPCVMMTYNPPHYPKLAEGAGFRKAMDLLAYLIPAGDVVRRRIDRVAAAIQGRGDIRIRSIDLSRFEKELEIVKDIYNDGWEKNWGFVPMSDEEIRFTAVELKAICLPELAYIAEHKGRPVGFALALPDINVALKRCNGSLWPFGWFHFLKFNLRKIPFFRVMVLGIRRGYQHLGIGTLFYQRYFDEGARMGVRGAELSWILETNDLMNRPLREMGARPYKRYRLYERPV